MATATSRNIDPPRLVGPSGSASPRAARHDERQQAANENIQYLAAYRALWSAPPSMPERSHGITPMSDIARPTSRHLVEASAVTKTASLMVLVFCLFSIFVYSTTGFMIFHPFFAILTAVGSVIFYCMGVVLTRSPKHER
jgi:hypothetical protein